MELSQKMLAFLQSRQQEFCDLYPTTRIASLVERFGVSAGTLYRWALHLGLKKDPAYRTEVQRQNATGRKLSETARAKLRQRALGRKMSDETKAKILDTKRKNGTLPRCERHYNWKGGRPWERFKEPRYIAWRKAVLERDGYVCQQCGRQCKKRERGLAAHHIKPYADHPDLRYEMSNGITLCRHCHMALHGRAPEPKEQIHCACGCGTLIDSVDPYGRPRRYMNHHSVTGRKVSDATKQLLRDQRKGKSLTSEHRAKIADGLRTSKKRIGRPKRG